MTEKVKDQAYRRTITVKVGPVMATYQGRLSGLLVGELIVRLKNPRGILAQEVRA